MRANVQPYSFLFSFRQQNKAKKKKLESAFSDSILTARDDSTANLELLMKKQKKKEKEKEKEQEKGGKEKHHEKLTLSGPAKPSMNSPHPFLAVNDPLFG